MIKVILSSAKEVTLKLRLSNLVRQATRKLRSTEYIIDVFNHLRIKNSNLVAHAPLAEFIERLHKLDDQINGLAIDIKYD